MSQVEISPQFQPGWQIITALPDCFPRQILAEVRFVKSESQLEQHLLNMENHYSPCLWVRSYNANDRNDAIDYACRRIVQPSSVVYTDLLTVIGV